MTNFPRRQFIGAIAATAAAAPFVHTAARAADKPKIRVGQIGTKHAHASGKMATMRKLSDDYEVVGIVEPDEARRKAVENTGVYRDLKWMSAEELLNTKGLAAVAVETDVKDLVPTAMQCVKAGAHVHLDKPAGESLSAFRQLLEEATKRKLTIQMGYMLRYNPAFAFCFKAVGDGWLGEPFELHAVMSKAVGAAARRDLARYAGGTMFELGCHIIDAAIRVLGRPDRVTPFVRRTRPQQDKLADNQLAVLEFEKATATIRSALLEVDGFKRRQFVVCGDEGTIDIRPLEPPTALMALSKPRDGFQRGYQEVALPESDGRYDGEFADLAKIIRGEKESDYTPSHDLAVHETVLRASGVPLD